MDLKELLPKAIAHFHELVAYSIKESEKESCKISEGLLEQLEDIRDNIKRIRHATNAQKEHSIKIGLFGSTNRGKSSLINVLAGVKILPEKPIPGWTRASIELEHSEVHNYFEITVTEDDDRFERKQFHSVKESYDHLLLFSGTSQQTNPKKIKVFGPFNSSKILKAGRILVDTPGVEKSFDRRDVQDLKEGNTDKVSIDTRQALKTLNSTHAVIFCLRADQLGNASDDEFYLKHLRKRLPLNVIGFRDKVPEIVDKELEEDAKMKYRTSNKKFFVISAKEEMTKIREIQQSSNKKTEEKNSNLERLIVGINKHINRLENGDEIAEFFIDYNKIISDLSLGIQPHKIRKIEFINLIEQLEEIASFDKIHWPSKILKNNNWRLR